MQITFNINDEVAKIFELSCLVVRKSMDDAFELCARNFAATVLKESKSSLNDCSNQPFDEKSSLNTRYLKKSYTESKAIRRLPLWANRPNQYNHGILRAFLKNENENGLASRAKMRDTFLKEYSEAHSWQFEQNFASMCTDEGNSHGKVFNVNGDNVILDSGVKHLVQELKTQFLK